MSEVKQPEYVPVSRGTIDESLPDVLILGDSISIGYTPIVARILAGTANVWRPDMNCGSTLVYREFLKKWLGDRKWDLIHFNCGLHDINRKNNESIGRTEGDRRVPLEEYVVNLEWITGTILAAANIAVWASTTPVPSEAETRVPGDEIEYNKAAEKVMMRKNVPVNDLNAFILPYTPECHLALNNVHYTEDGYEKLGAEVVAVIKNQF